MEGVVNAAKAELANAKKRMEKVLAATPDDKINWSPGPNARTPVQVVAHAALSVTGIQGMLEGKPFPWANIEEADRAWRVDEAKFTSREQVVELLNKNVDTYFAWLDSLSAEQLASEVRAPMGTFPLSTAITFPAFHLSTHTAQLDYIQTILGDRDMHF
jgi:hypothetical protein